MTDLMVHYALYDYRQGINYEMFEENVDGYKQCESWWQAYERWSMTRKRLWLCRAE